MPTADPRGPAADEAPETRGSGSVRSLTRAIARGDTEAFGEFYEAWFDRTFAMARSVSRRDESFCLDIVQDTMLRVVRYMKPLATEESLGNWMGRAVLSATIDRLRREKRRPEREREAAARLLALGGERVADKEQIEKAALADPRIIEQLEGKTLRKVIVVPGKIVNIVAN